MALEAKLVQKMSQSLLMTPQLQQAIKLLQLGRLEYKEAIEKELLENPILEEVRESGDSGESATPSNEFEGGAGEAQDTQIPVEVEAQVNTPEGPADHESYLESFSDAHGSSSARGQGESDDRSPLEASVSRAETLQEYLLNQLRMADVAPEDQPIALQILGNLDKNGYLCSSYEELAKEAGCSVEDVIRVIEIFRGFDPAGVGARDLGECLLIQLENMEMGSALPARIVRDHLDKLERRKYDQIAKVEKVTVQEVYRAVSVIRTLEPRPGRQFADEATRYVVPDIYVQKVAGEYVITLNEEGLPRLRVSPYYMQLLKSGEYGNNPNRVYLNERLKAASWLIKSIHQRQQTIYKVTESIMKFQREFLDLGIERLKPLVLKDVADDIGMHESTVSRVTTNKYVHTPQGVFELKFFFTSGIKSAEGDLSSSSIKEKIKNLIAAEDQQNPISDQQIVDILKKDNIDIARRTVAKYREGLGILSSSKRKKLF